jgi:N-acetylmuramoyl-L-alanine amidase
MNAKTTFRTILMVLAALALFAGMLTPTVSALAAEGTQGKIVADALNLRKGPALSYDVIKVLPYGTSVNVLETSSDGAWLKVSLADGTQGWVFKAYVTATATVTTSDGVVLVDVLNLRIGPGASYKVVETLKKGDKLTISGRSLYSEWLQVKTADGDQGWVFSPYVQTSVSVGSLPVTEAYGGPNGSPTSSTPMSLVVTIRNNEAGVSLRNFPANSKVSAWLGLSKSALDLKVVSGTTNASGSAELSFEMPDEWSNGKALESGTMVLVVKTDDGSFSRSATILYYTY